MRTAGTKFLPIEALPLERFTWTRVGRTVPVDRSRMELVAEASDFGTSFRISRLYEDAADVGIAIHSHLTGRVERFYLDFEETHAGEITAWHFRPVDPAHGCRVMIIND